MKKILIIEDDLDIMQTFRAGLESQNYKVLEAYDGLSALDVLDTKKVDLILLDVRMPRMDGLELLKEINSQEKFNDLKIIMITGYDIAIKEQKKYFDLGANEFLEKPVELDALREIVKKWIG